MDVDQVRRMVVESLPRLGYPKAEPNWETLLVSDGRPTGCRFEFDRVRAYWFASRQAVEFYRDDWVPLTYLPPDATLAAEGMGRR